MQNKTESRVLTVLMRVIFDLDVIGAIVGTILFIVFILHMGGVFG